MSSSPEGLSLPPQPRTNVGATVLVASGVVGAALGLRYATWQWAVELAQVSAGLVHYPPDAPASALRYHFWSLLDQLIGTALRAGVSERTLSWCLSALAGMASAQALAMLTLALTRAPLPSLLVPIVLMSVDLTAYGPGYPLMLVGLPHTYGMLGLAVAMLALGLIGCGSWRSGAALAGLAIGVQFPIGVFVAACMVMAAFSQRARVPAATVMAFGAGLCCTAISYGVFIANRLPVPQVESATAHVFLQAFVAAWDAHRMPIRWMSRGVVADVAVLAATVGWLAFGTSQSLAVSSRLMLRTLAFAAAMSLPLAGLTHLAFGSLPDAIVVAMPARLLNIGIFAAVPVLASVAFVAVQRRGFSSLRRTRAAWWLAAAGTVAVSLAFPVGRLAREPTSLHKVDPVWATAAARPGMLLTSADLWLAQLRTRRPVLLEGATLDTLPYALDAAPAVERILNDVYGQSLVAPPPDAGRRGQIASRTNREAWEGFTPDRWADIRRRYGVTDVLTPVDWPLQLPVVAASPVLRLYEIPLD